jgi:hypothetical protein
MPDFSGLSLGHRVGRSRHQRNSAKHYLKNCPSPASRQQVFNERERRHLASQFLSKMVATPPVLSQERTADHAVLLKQTQRARSHVASKPTPALGSLGVSSRFNAANNFITFIELHCKDPRHSPTSAA